MFDEFDHVDVNIKESSSEDLVFKEMGFGKVSSPSTVYKATQIGPPKLCSQFQNRCCQMYFVPVEVGLHDVIVIVGGMGHVGCIIEHAYLVSENLFQITTVFL